MTTRPGDLLQRQRRRSRQALAVIPDMTGLTMSFGSPVASPNTMTDIRDRMSPWHGIASSSPDELVIQKRGRRSKTIIFSPDADSKRNSLLSYSLSERTPTKVDNELQSPMMLRDRMAIKKKLDLSEDCNESMLASPEKTKISYHEGQFNGNNLASGLKGLSQKQLVNVIMDLVVMQEQGNLSLDNKLRDVIMKIMPAADTNPLQEQLRLMRQNIYDSLASSNNSYMDVYIHLDAFSTALKEQGNVLMHSQHWISLMEYVFAAWAITKELPMRNDDNTSRKCFSHLAHFCKQALNNGKFSDSALAVYAERMEAMIRDCGDMKICLQMAREILR